MLLEINEKSFVNGVKKKAQSKSEKFVCYKNCFMICKRNMARAGLKNHFRNLQAPLCGIFYSHSVAVARYAALIRIKSPTNWDSQLTISLFQTRSSVEFFG